MTAPNEAILQIRGLTKRFGDFTALDGVDLDIAPGEIFALLGPNGAGKTTLIGCVTGLAQASSGSIFVGGHDATKDFKIARQLIGLVPQELNYDGFFSTRDTLAYHAAYFGVPFRSPIHDELLRDFSLLEKAEENSRSLSGGMKRRLINELPDCEVSEIETNRRSIEAIFKSIVAQSRAGEAPVSGNSRQICPPNIAPALMETGLKKLAEVRGRALQNRGFYGTYGLFRREIARFLKIFWGSMMSPVLTTMLWFLVFGYSLGDRLKSIQGIPYVLLKSGYRTRD